MTPSARLQAVVNLLSEIQVAWESEGAAADDLIAHYFRKRRYAGSKDRRDVIGRVYDILRNYEALKWQLSEGGQESTPRLLLIANLKRKGEFDPAQFGADRYGLAGLDEAEKKFSGAGDNDMPLSARLNVPDWLVDPLQKQFGAGFEAEMTAMMARAPFDLRVNTLKTDRETVRKMLDAVATQFSPFGLRFAEPQQLSQHSLYQNGQIEIQDESAQVASLLCDVKPGMQMLDFCAGAGGKTLALAAIMENKGQIFAYDLDARRLKELEKRRQRAGARNIQCLKSPPAESLKFDRVVLDLPCSGSGTWRRNPELRQRLNSKRLMEVCGLQETLLAQGASLVKPGGRLIYMTCSILDAENDQQVDAFLQQHTDWRLLDYREILKDLGLSLMPETRSRNDHTLLLTPATHGTDGFFTAVLEFCG